MGTMSDEKECLRITARVIADEAAKACRDLGNHDGSLFVSSMRVSTTVFMANLENKKQLKEVIMSLENFRFYLRGRTRGVLTGFQKQAFEKCLEARNALMDYLQGSAEIDSDSRILSRRVS